MAEIFPRIRAAAIDGRAHNVFYRQAQLEQLCQALISNASKLRDAIATDYRHSPAETAVELNLAISAIRRDYATLDPKQAHAEEYLIASGEDAPGSTRPVGVVYIEPCTHTLLYSVVVPLSAAIAAGNCVIVLLENNLRAVSSLLRQILPSALDRDTFAITSSPIDDQSFLGVVAHVNQNDSERWPRANQISSPARSRTVAVVDRTANVELAARELVAARFRFGGRSPYAPDIVFVNEFVRQSFLQAVVAECVKLESGVAADRDAKPKSSASSRVSEPIEALRETDSGLRVIVQERNFAVVELTSRISDLLAQKNTAPVLVVHTIRSLDDVIDLVTSTSTGIPALTAYHFSNPASAKYLTQFIDANVSFANNVPRELLVGPAFPAAHTTDLSARYPPQLFTESRPAYIKPAARSQTLTNALVSGDNAAVKSLMAEVIAPLAAMKRHPGGGVGFFEQGFLMNAALILTTTLSLSGAGIYWIVKYRRAA
ncbi:hypothetical protein B0A55_07522 [Friedmanniomyces simplex]|uniref:Aldehyde dehydrogenase domain-containing protein n=1 Tax=Friedmanniomyces simplex TaxID=329884 RepID=A0A4U0X4F3_9PEZI|nr:hypothetical protein B0A55_07522 [Friedmanniomyces simplex]